MPSVRRIHDDLLDGQLGQRNLIFVADDLLPESQRAYVVRARIPEIDACRGLYLPEIDRRRDVSIACELRRSLVAASLDAVASTVPRAVLLDDMIWMAT